MRAEGFEPSQALSYNESHERTHNTENSDNFTFCSEFSVWRIRLILHKWAWYSRTFARPERCPFDHSGMPAYILESDNLLKYLFFLRSMAGKLFLNTRSTLAQQEISCTRAEGHEFHLTYYLLRDGKARMQCSYCKATHLRDMASTERWQYSHEKLIVDPVKTW